MKDLIFFFDNDCQKCKDAMQLLLKYKNKLIGNKKVNFVEVDVKLNASFARMFGFKEVPSFFVDGRFFCEGEVDEQKLQDLFKEVGI